MAYPNSRADSRLERKISWSLSLFTAVATVLSVVIGVLFTWFLIDVQDTLREFEHRITVLETRAGSASGQIVVLGGFPWNTSKEYDFTPEGQVRLGLDIDILSEQFRWACGSPTTVVRGDTPVDLAGVVSGYSRNQQLKGVKGIIAVGTASMEGLVDGQEELARSRVETLVNLLHDNISVPEMPIYGYWLGQYTGGEHDAPCTSITANQRRVVLLKILEMEEGLSMKEIEESITQILLRKATTEGILFPIDVRDYSRFKGRKDLLLWGRNLQSSAEE